MEVSLAGVVVKMEAYRVTARGDVDLLVNFFPLIENVLFLLIEARL